MKFEWFGWVLPVFIFGFVFSFEPPLATQRDIAWRQYWDQEISEAYFNRAQANKDGMEYKLNQIDASNVHLLGVHNFWILQGALRRRGKTDMAEDLLDLYSPELSNLPEKLDYYGRMAAHLTEEQLAEQLAQRPVSFDELKSIKNITWRNGIAIELNACQQKEKLEDRRCRALMKLHGEMASQEWFITMEPVTNLLRDQAGWGKEGLAWEEVERLQKEERMKSNNPSAETTSTKEIGVGFNGTCFFGPADELDVKNFCQGVFDLFTGNLNTAKSEQKDSLRKNSNSTSSDKTYKFTMETELLPKTDLYSACFGHYNAQLSLAGKITKFQPLEDEQDSFEGRSFLSLRWKDEENNGREKTVSLENVLKLSIDLCAPEVIKCKKSKNSSCQLQENVALRTLIIFNQGFEVFKNHLDGPFSDSDSSEVITTLKESSIDSTTESPL